LPRRQLISGGKGDERAASFSIFFSSSRAEVESGERKAAKGNVSGETRSYELGGLQIGQVYFWRVDQLDARGNLLQAGLTRSFSIDSGSARNPSPHNLHGSVPPDLKRLQWEPGTVGNLSGYILQFRS